MEQTRRLHYLIDYLKKERPEYRKLDTPAALTEQKRMLRALMNVRPPMPVADDILEMQNAYLKEELSAKGVVTMDQLQPAEDGIYLWQGDITTLACDAIVNAANSAMLGCFVPCHGCIDNAIHSAAGMQLRRDCQALMEKQGHEEPTGSAKITRAYNLPCKYVLHTVGPIIYGPLRDRDRDLLASCYRSCLALADSNGVKTIAFCCISTGEFHFPNEEAAKIAVDTVRTYRKETNTDMEVIFNVFKDQDREIYERLLGIAG